jgi:FtsP/CotA-like multicopper oxidase with cupredoxin domain
MLTYTLLAAYINLHTHTPLQHGHSFWVVGSGVGDYNKDTDPQKFNLDKPAYKDTAVVYPGSWAAIRFVANNPGAWPFHCHIAAHFRSVLHYSLCNDE